MFTIVCIQHVSLTLLCCRNKIFYYYYLLLLEDTAKKEYLFCKEERLLDACERFCLEKAMDDRKGFIRLKSFC